PHGHATAEEREVHPGIARGFDIGALRAGPVRIVPRRDENLVLLDLVAAAIAVDTREVADFIAVPLEPSDERQLGVEELLADRVQPVVERAVVARHIRPGGGFVWGASPASGASVWQVGSVETRASVSIECHPRWVRSLEEHRRSAGIVTHDEDDV